MRRAHLVVLFASLLTGCLQPASRQCDDGSVCPPGLRCASGEAGVCVLPTCGNGQLDAGEECDDGNNTSGDECPADCTFLSPIVPGGTFYRGYDQGTDEALRETRYPATVSTFRLDKHEVTVRRFRQFVDAGMGTWASPPRPGDGAHPNIPGSGWDERWNSALPLTTARLRKDLERGPIAVPFGLEKFFTWTSAPGPNEDRPINAISWYEAFAFCAWDGGRLPTATEWSYAATGGDQQRAYPWSDPPDALIIDSAHASYGEPDVGGLELSKCFGDGMPDCAPSDLVEVGTKPAGDGRWGHSDLAGNVSEWTLDWYSETPVIPCVDCANLVPPRYGAEERLTRGGNFTSRSGAQRSNVQPGVLYDLPPAIATGVRCARSAP